MKRTHPFLILLTLIFFYFNQGTTQECDPSGPDCTSEYPVHNIEGYLFKLVYIIEDCTDPNNPTSTWYYCVTSPDDIKALSHIVFQFCNLNDIDQQTILDAGYWIGTPPNAQHKKATFEWVNPDPTTGATGLKFDDDFEEEETRGVYFKLNGIYDIGSGGSEGLSIGIKAGQMDGTFATDLEGPCLPTTGPCGPILPIRLLSFEVIPNGGVVEIAWSAMEIENFDRFELEHSEDSKYFLTIETFGAIGSETVYDQTFYHDNPTHGANFYRLKMIDLDGSFSYSSVLMAHCSPALESLRVFPNPTVGNLSICLSTENEHYLGTIHVYNSIGQLEKYWDISANHLRETVLDLAALTRGTYMIKIRSTKGLEVSKAILLN